MLQLGKGSMAGALLCLVARLSSVLFPALYMLMGMGLAWLAGWSLGISAYSYASVGQAGEGSSPRSAYMSTDLC